ncbi:MAG TPA: hypothetical protein PKD78_01425 [Saprospiraceae bacterium]|nr:hypothetical protein [Saprospiraceae bacterium]
MASTLCLSAQPQQVRTGVYLMNLYSLNADEHSFYADFYIWFKWKGKKDPTKIEFVNAIEKWSMDEATYDGDSTPVQLKDGVKYKIMRIEGRFFHSFSLNRFPLDRHELDIQIENPDFAADSIVYVPDTSGFMVRPSLNLVGWKTEGCRLTHALHDYGTNFGNAQENARKYSNLSFSIILARPVSYFLLKMLLPLCIVLLVSIGALLLHPTHIDTRSSLPIGGLLTAVFLQQSYSDALPDTGYMVLMDKIYLVAYALISLVLWQVIRAGNDLAHEQPAAPIIRRERKWAERYVLIFLIAVLALVIFDL